VGKSADVEGWGGVRAESSEKGNVGEKKGSGREGKIHHPYLPTRKNVLSWKEGILERKNLCSSLDSRQSERIKAWCVGERLTPGGNGWDEESHR